MKIIARSDDFEARRKHLASLSDEELKATFWCLANQAVEPLVDLAKTHTSPSLERSVLLRMGFSSLEAKALVEKVMAHELMGKGAGHVVFRYHQLASLPIREAGLALINGEGWDKVIKSFGGHHE
ncbi:MAG: ornithine aminomutase subunit alpha [Bacilli bacterium]|nr:ornithine aminomutase subunit alpha [Bacilli bacterium]